MFLYTLAQQPRRIQKHQVLPDLADCTTHESQPFAMGTILYRFSVLMRILQNLQGQPGAGRDAMSMGRTALHGICNCQREADLSCRHMRCSD